MPTDETQSDFKTETKTIHKALTAHVLALPVHSNFYDESKP
jgi:hypothetical protein